MQLPVAPGVLLGLGFNSVGVWLQAPTHCTQTRAFVALHLFVPLLLSLSGSQQFVGQCREVYSSGLYPGYSRLV